MNLNKTWDRPWEIQEIVDNADKWSLAGDAGLLKYLEKFSDNLLSKAEETNNNLNNLSNNIGEVNLKLDIAKNKFLSLQNTQFIESRVYEDEDIEEQVNGVEKNICTEQKDEISKEALQAAVLKGISIMNEYYEKVEVPISDSEEDGDSSNFVLQPKDPYIDRPLPYVIGTDEWYKKWHVGLQDSSSDEETDKLSDNFGGSESEDDTNMSLNNTKQTYKDEFGNGMKPPVANSTFNDASTEDIFDSDSDDNHSYPAQAAASSGNFAQQLSRKLDNIVQNEVVEEPVNRRPIMKPNPASQYITNIFDDEPPPLPEGGKTQRGMFSSGQGLFDDSESETENDLWSNNTDKSHKPDEKRAEPVKNEDPSKGLFDSDSDDDLFANKRNKIQQKSSFLPPSRNMDNLFPSDAPPELAKESTSKKKPVGGISPFGNINLFGDDGLNNISQSLKKASDFSPVKVESPPEDDVKPPAKNVVKDDVPTPAKEKSKDTADAEIIQKPSGLFDVDVEDLFNDDFLSNASAKKFTSNLFDSDSDDEFLAKTTKTNKQSDVKSDKKLLFLDDEGTDKDLFNINTKKSEREEIAEEKQQSPSPPSELETAHGNPNNAAFHIDIFGTTPPPIDNEWDVPEETVDEIVPYELSSIHGRSSLFDNEPPSLTVNQTSGIVKDYSQEGSDCSFLPHAMSTRRSSEQDQYSSAYLVTKHSSIMTALDTIPEPQVDKLFDTQSLIDVTPSGLSCDLYESDENVRTIEDDVFMKNETDDVQIDPVSDEILSTGAEPNSPEKDKKDLPGKLSHNLNINVNALLPGAYGALKGKTEKPEEVNNKSDNSASVLSGNDKEVVETLPCVTKDRAKVFTKRRPSTRRGRKEQLRKTESDFNLNVERNSKEFNQQKESESSNESSKESNNPAASVSSLVGFAKESNNTDLIHAKVDDFLEEPKHVSLFDDLDSVPPIVSKENVASKPLPKSLFDDDDDEDLFSTKHVDIVKAQNKSKDEKPSIAADKNDLFDVNVNRKEMVQSKTKSLFDDDSNDDMFFNDNKRRPKEEVLDNSDEDALNKNRTKSKSKPKTKSLFDDEDEDSDDIFGKSNNKPIAIDAKRPSKPRAEPKKTNLKTVTSDPIDDPLNVFKP